MDTTKLLFGIYPREVGLFRQLIYSPKEMERYLFENNGLHDCYTSIYPTNYLIDKIFFDFDDNGSEVLEDAKRVYRWCLERKYQVIPIVSGRKGLHEYIILKPRIYGKDAKLLLTKATYSIIKSVFGPFKQELHVTPRGKEVQVFRNKDRIIAVDPAPCGDIRRISRIPNTLRPPENNNYCTYLPPDEFLNMTENDVAEFMKRPHTYDYKIDFRKAPLLTDFPYEFDEEMDFSKWSPISKRGEVIVTDNPSLFLKGLLRPCLFRHLNSQHPSHPVRVASTVDLFQAGYSSTEILSLYEKLGWSDFEFQYCLEQIESCKKYKPYSNTKLRSLGILMSGES